MRTRIAQRHAGGLARSDGRRLPRLICVALLSLLAARAAGAQAGGGHTVFGDLKVDDSKVEGLRPISFMLVLYSVRGGSVIARQSVPKNGRYRFENVPNGNYDIVVEMEGAEVTRVRISVLGATSTDHRRDISLEWRVNAAAGKGPAPGVVPADAYRRTDDHQRLFARAQDAVKRRDHEQALALLRQLTSADPKDFEAWTELGTVHFMMKNPDEAERAYLRALAERPAFSLALFNLGKLRMARRDFKGAVEVLSAAVRAQPASADANHFLGEAYLAEVLKEIGEGSQDITRLNETASRAVSHFTEALRLDPTGKAEIHLRLADIYNVLGMKPEAVAECEKFLSKRPGYPDRKKIEQFIAVNKKK